MMSLDRLAGPDCPESAADLMIEGLSADSRTVRDNYLFAAIRGTAVDGTRFIPDAKANGAVAVLADPDAHALAEGLAFVPDPNPRARLARMAALFYGAQPDCVVAVTGTNGKTSVADFVRQIFTHLGEDAASLGTLGLIAPGVTRDLGHTTPDPVTIHEALAEIAGDGVTHLALEASSHGLDQHRLDGVCVAHAAFTNISRDHLDYHPDFDSYFAAKRRLVQELTTPGGTLVLNLWRQSEDIAQALMDDAEARGLALMSCGTPDSDLALLDHALGGAGQKLTIGFGGEVYTVTVPLIGDFQASNVLVAAGLVLAEGVEPEKVMAALETLEGVPGRMELVGEGVLVDYAHTPAGLETALQAARPHTQGRVIVVFGCGGDRDTGKRTPMGEIAARLADQVIVTDDNPRSEDPAAIRKEILSGAPDAQDIGDRRAAIKAAIAARRPGDLVLIAGKGHEQGQKIGTLVHPFDDRDEARRALLEVRS